MAVSAKLELRQGQQLVMTPQLQQAIRLLQLSNIELSTFVEGELERNPLLEREDAGEPAVDAAEDDGGSAEEYEDGEASTRGELDLAEPSQAACEALDTDWDNVDPHGSIADHKVDAASQIADGDGLGSWASVAGHAGGSFDDDEQGLERFAVGEPTLTEHLERQLGELISDPVERMIAHHLTDQLDESGYLRVDMGDLAAMLGAPVELIEAVLIKAQQCEPAGVFARSLSECLALQLRERNRWDPVIAALLDNLHMLAAHNLPGLRRAVGVDADELSEMILEIKRLDPKPGLQFGGAPVQPVVPDIIVRVARDGSWRIELNSDTLPRVLINRAYYANVSRNSSSDKDKGYLSDCLQSANWLVKSLDQRARTILRVAEEIVRQQDAFLTWGIQHLRPLNLKTVADAVSLHESTVSRVTSNKYISTPRGIFDLKYFFTSAIATSDGGEAHSSETVRHRIKQLIEAEQASAVLSDDSIVDLLQAEGIDIARRTVAKYRESLRIPSSVQRRRAKRLVSGTGKRHGETLVMAGRH